MTVTATYSWNTVVSSSYANDVVTTNAQNSVAAVAFGDGGWAAAWNDGFAPGDVRARVFTTASTAVGSEFLLNSTTTNAQTDSAGALLNDGRAVFVFTDTSTWASGHIHARLIGTSGSPVGNDFQISDGFPGNRSADVAALSNGNYVVTWTTDLSGGNYVIDAKIFNGSALVGGSISVEGSQDLSANYSSVAGLLNGNFVVAWQQGPRGGGAQEVRFRRFDASGTAIDANSVLIDAVGNNNSDIQVIGLRDGGFAVAYTDNGWALGGTEISFRIYEANGTPRTDVLRVNFTVTAGDQNNPTLTQLDNGMIIVGWSSGQSGYQTAFTNAGAMVAGTEFTIAGVIEAELVALNHGQVASVRSSTVADAGGNDSIRYSVNELVRTQQGDNAQDVMPGDDLRDVMDGGGGNDLLTGYGGNDTLFGGSGLDVAYYPGAEADFAFAYNAATKVFTITDKLGAASSAFDNGVDQLSGVEYFWFDDYIVAAAAFVGPPKDFNGDGFSDILWRNDAGTAQIWNMDGGTLLGTGNLGNIPAAWKIAGTGDFDGDGRDDLLWRNDNTGVAQIWTMNNGTISSTYSLGVIPAAWKVLDTGDFNGDGMSDILWRNDSNGVTQIWNMASGTILGTANLGVMPAVWQFAGSGDFNGDLKTDLLWRNSSTNVVQLWTMDNGTITNAQSLGIIPASWKIEGIADFNGDAKSDLLWRNDSNGATQIWNMDGSTIQSTRSLGNIPSNWQVADVADYTGDTNADILWRNTTNGVVQLWELDDAAITTTASLGVVPNNWQVIA